MTDAAHANNLRAYIVGDCDYDIHVEAAIERAIEVLEGATAIPRATAIPKMRSTAMAEREQKFRTGTDVIMAEPVEAAPSDTPLTAPQAFIPKAER